MTKEFCSELYYFQVNKSCRPAHLNTVCKTRLNIYFNIKKKYV